MAADLDAARAALERFWGRSNGGRAAWRECFDALQTLKLKPADLERLRLRLPATTGMVGLRVATLQKMLEELALG